MSRREIYYWKCDRPAAFHGTQVRVGTDTQTEVQLSDALRRHFDTASVALEVAPGQGNHLTWNAVVDTRPMFVRVENGPEKDDHLEVESAVMGAVGKVGVPVPQVYACDATRTRVPFAWQALERINAPDLNQWQKQGRLNVLQIARDLGVAVAKWQNIRPPGFGPFDPQAWRQGQQLHGYHSTYEAYFRLKLDHHLDFLHGRGFLTRAQCEDIEGIVEKHRGLLDLAGGCLVHKDLALWNVLGSEDTIAAFIDFDDAISGDPMDDLSLLACFHDAAFLKLAFEGYQSIRPLPADYRRRFWLHLLRNMVVKAVIRVGAGYFDRGDSFFLVGAGSSGADLKEFTHDRITLALHGLAGDADMDIL